MGMGDERTEWKKREGDKTKWERGEGKKGEGGRGMNGKFYMEMTNKKSANILLSGSISPLLDLC